MSKKDAARPGVVLLLVLFIPMIAATFLPKAIHSAVNGNFGNSWAGFVVFGIFFFMGIAGLISILSPARQTEDNQKPEEAEKQIRIHN